MKCRDCEKKLQGGFKDENGLFQCSRCVTIEVEKNSDAGCFSQINKTCSEIIKSKKRPKMSEIRYLQSIARAALETNHKNSKGSKWE